MNTVKAPKRTTLTFFPILVFVLSVFSSTWLLAAGPTAAEYGVVLNLSGKQRMLSQKMSKEVMLIALGVESDKNLSNLAATAKLFDRTLKGLRRGDAELRLPPTENGRILRQLGKVDTLWATFHAVIDGILKTGKVSAADVQAIAAQSPVLLKEMNKCVLLYEKDASKAGLKNDPGLAVTINLSGKQRMLTQKMSKEFFLIAYGLDVENNKLNLLETYSLFERTLKGLLDGDASLDLAGTKDATIRAQLEKVDGLWQGLKPEMVYACEPGTTSIAADRLAKVASQNLPLLKEMNGAVGMYEQLAAQ
nr:type IV pili methyl-accepting chemotaxis transducer N-terminal domain-containing protein [uncultured Desulfobulbus sp.]